MKKTVHLDTSFEEAERRDDPTVALCHHFNAFQAVFAACHEAAEKLREGHRNVPFPEGCFPPRLLF